MGSSLVLVAQASGHHIADLSRAGWGLGKGSQWGWHGHLSLSGDPPAEWGVTGLGILGVALRCHVPPASGGAIYPGSQFNEPQEGLHGLPLVCLSVLASISTNTARQMALLTGCMSLPALLPAPSRGQPAGFDLPSQPC